MVFHKDKDLSIKNESNNGLRVHNDNIERVRFNHFIYVKKKISLNYLYGIKRYLSAKVMAIMLNASVNSVIDYGLDIWAVQSPEKLTEIQGKVKRFVISYFLPGIMRRSKLGYDRIKKGININDLLSKCNFLSISERIEFVILKDLFKDVLNGKIVFSPRSKDKNMPLMEVPSFKSQLFRNSILYKGANIWNQLPKDWILLETSYVKFKELVKDWIISKRSDVFVKQPH